MRRAVEEGANLRLGNKGLGGRQGGMRESESGRLGCWVLLLRGMGRVFGGRHSYGNRYRFTCNLRCSPMQLLKRLALILCCDLTARDVQCQ